VACLEFSAVLSQVPQRVDTCLKCSVWGWKINGTSLELRIWGTKIRHSRRVPVEPLNPSLWEFRFRPKTENQVSGVASTIFLALGEQQYFYLGRHFSKHKMTGYATKLGWHGPLTPPGYAYGPGPYNRLRTLITPRQSTAKQALQN